MLIDLFRFYISSFSFNISYTFMKFCFFFVLKLIGIRFFTIFLIIFKLDISVSISFFLFLIKILCTFLLCPCGGWKKKTSKSFESSPVKKWGLFSFPLYLSGLTTALTIECGGSDVDLLADLLSNRRWLLFSLLFWFLCCLLEFLCLESWATIDEVWWLWGHHTVREPGTLKGHVCTLFGSLWVIPGQGSGHGCGQAFGWFQTLDIEAVKLWKT